jgi:hypothetical protein
MAINLDHVTEQIQVTDVATNASLTVQSKGTGAFNVAAGSSGVNISNGGTVTAITRTNFNGTYTSVPTVAISAPTTAGGVQATANAINMVQSGNTPTINSGGTGYTNGDVLTIVGGTPTGSAATMTVTSVSGGVITGVSYANFATYSVVPTNPFSVTGGTGSGATFTSVWYPSAFTVTNAGSGYVEQPTVTFSGGGGSGAAAYATVGSGTTVRSLGATLDLFNSAGTLARFLSTAAPIVSYPEFTSSQFGTVAYYSVNGTGPNIGLQISSKAAGSITFQTSFVTQFNIVNTTSAVNFVQVTGAATGSAARISAQGSDSLVSLGISSKGAGDIFFQNSGSSATGFIIKQGSGSIVNHLQVTSSATGVAPVLSAQGSDTNIGLSLTAKGAGDINFFANSNDIGFKVSPNGTTGNSWVAYGSSVSPVLEASGSATNVNGIFRTKGSGIMVFRTNTSDEQLRINPTASAVNYVQVTGAATGANPAISAQGSDANISLNILSKANGNIFFNAGTTNRVQIDPFGGVNLAISFSGGVGFKALATSNQVNFLQAAGAIAGSAPILSAQGSDTNIDISFVPKGTGLVSFGTYTGTALSIAGYIEIKDAGGTIRRLAVVA